MRLAALAALALAGSAPAMTPPPARIQVSAQEFSFGLSRPAIKAGLALVELANFGEDAHDLRLRRIGGTRTYAIPEVQAGGSRVLSARFLPGKFVLWCSISDHRARGMHATLVVR